MKPKSDSKSAFSRAPITGFDRMPFMVNSDQQDILIFKLFYEFTFDPETQGLSLILLIAKAFLGNKQ